MRPMKHFPEYQAQHRIPQVYLKHFGFERDGNWCVTVWEREKDYTEIVEIKKFTTVINEFDYPYEDLESRRHFENTCGVIESNYNSIIKSIVHQKKLINRHRQLLCYFIASLVCRNEHYRWFFKELIKSNIDKFLKEITITKEHSLPDYKNGLEILKQEFHLNFLMSAIANHFTKVLMTFNAVIIRSYKDRAWFTSDNPVVIDKKENFNYIIPVEAEFYLPLSRDYCLFMFHPASEKCDKETKALQSGKVYITDEKTHTEITDKIFHTHHRFIIFPIEIEASNFKDPE